MLPNFLIVGAEKAGTTTLASTLADHPDVFMCDPKEPRFFSNHTWDKGLSWYESLFDNAGGHKAIGEASPAYTWAPDFSETPKRIHQILGDIRYLYIVRNPVDRMISHYQHALFFRWIPDNTSFEAALELVPALKNCSRYYYQIEQYFPYTQPEQWHIVVLDELTRDADKTTNEIFKFLEIREIPGAQLQTQNVSGQKRRAPVLVEQLKFLSSYLPAPVVQFGKQLVNNYGKSIEKPTIPEGMRLALMEELKPDIQKLSNFSGKNLPSLWHAD